MIFLDYPSTNLRRYVSRYHVNTVARRLVDLECLRKPPEFHSIDGSLILGKYSFLIERSSLMEWMLWSAKMVAQLNTRYFRVIPIPRRNFTVREVDQIKLTLHALLCLGSIVFIRLDPDDDFLMKNFETDNVMLMRGGFSMLTRGRWSSREQTIETLDSTDRLDVFDCYKRPAWREANDTLRLSYGMNAFNCGVLRTDPLRERFGHLLYYLQGGFCAITNEPIAYKDAEVDHVFPSSKGGTNVLINLQVVDRKVNRIKSNDIAPGAVRIFDEAGLLEINLDCMHPYLDLVRRDVRYNPLGYLRL